MKKIIKYMIFALLISVIFGVNNSVYAFDDIDFEYGLYCGYKNQDGFYYFFKYYGGSKEQEFELHQNFDGGEFQDEPSLGVAIEFGRPDKPVTDESEINWLKEKGLLNSEGNFVCPTNPFGTNLGSPIEYQCGGSGCHIYDIPTEYETYTCNYVGQGTGKKLTIVYNYDANGTWRKVTYPDGTTKMLTGSALNGHIWPGKDCNDVYYITTTKQINVAIGANEGVTNNATLGGLCKNHKQYEIEHYCSGECTYPEMLCSSDSIYDGTIFETDEYGCPNALRPIIFFIKKLVFNTLQIFIPIILILMGTIDFVKASISSDDKSNKEAISKFIKRVLAAVFMFFIVTIVSVVMNMLASTDEGAKDDWKACWNNID